VLFLGGPPSPPAAKTLTIAGIGTGPVRMRSPAPLPGATVDTSLTTVVLDGSGPNDLDYRRLEAGARLAVPAIAAMAGP
jgi:hypothetical protein